MNLLLLTISHQVGFLASSILTYAAAFVPFLILIVCLIGLLILACVPGWMREAKLLDEALDFDRECGPEKPNLLKLDPDGGLERQYETTGGAGSYASAATVKLSTPDNNKHNSTKCIKPGSGASASHVG